jgi:hypothetical protein
MGCRDNVDDSFSGFATADVNGVVFESQLPQFKVRNETDQATNQEIEVTELIFQGRNGTTITITFPGTQTGSFVLNSSATQSATYFSEIGNEFISFSGAVVIDKYQTSSTQTTIAGSFTFQAQSILDQSFIGVDNGIFNVVKAN